MFLIVVKSIIDRNYRKLERRNLYTWNMNKFVCDNVMLSLGIYFEPIG